MTFFGIVLGVVLLQRGGELFLASRNARHIRARGGYEVGEEHYKYIVTLHLLFFVSLLLEVSLKEAPFALPAWWMYPFSLFLLAQFLRYWCMQSLGRHWNTRILILPGAQPVIRGPYRFLRHPNYLVVAVELFSLPLSFSAFLTAITFSILNAWLLLRIRIPLEEKSLYEPEK
ncbi:isoprenylcysteine carboxyl methyltransferase family protein [Brevibacillus sp. NRS-1366]|uniref:isoprenylcysteine carboxyl methyltransferase family protein n=1 Tax=Brevibacillus sp. NRS-1366 TaxID=3233899 RepID=UPI003D1ABC6B